MNIAVRLHRDLALEYFRRRRMADGDEDAVGRDLVALAGFQVLQPRAGDAQRRFLPENLFKRGVPDHMDLLMREQPLLQDALGAQLAAAVHKGNLAGMIGEEQRFLDGRIAAADHQHLLAAVEKTIAGGAGGNAEALEFGLACSPSQRAWAPVAMTTVSA